MLHTAYLARHNFFVDLNRLICKERRVTSGHFINEDTECPPVDCFIVTLKLAQKNIHKQSAKSKITISYPALHKHSIFLSRHFLRYSYKI